LKTSSTLILKITADDEGARLDKYLSSLEEMSSRNYAKNLIDKNLVRVNSKSVKASYSLRLNDTVEVSLPELAPTDLVPYDFKLDIVFEDQDIIVVNKPSGLVVHPAAGHQQDTLVNALLFHTQELSMKNEMRPGIVHRIDKETSGLLVIAKNDNAHEKLSQQFKDKSMHRIYYALLDGQLAKPQGVCRSYLARHPVDRKRFSSIRDNHKIITDPEANLEYGKWAVTHFTKLAIHKKMTYVRLKLETGRTHQIRVHMNELTHSLVGDLTYGYSIKKMKELGLKRFFLHAAELGFVHPRTNEYVMFKVAWPKEDNDKLIEFGFDHDKLSK
jgi:23S rRNA pseudouridine1911/1915/1917 synthase